MLTQVLGGQGGRLFVELRDKQSLAYSVTAFEMEGVDPGIFAVYMAGDPAKLDESLDGIRGELDKVVNEPVGDEELVAREGLPDRDAGRVAAALRRAGDAARRSTTSTAWARRTTWTTATRISAVSAADVQRVAKRVIRLDAPVVAIIKPLARERRSAPVAERRAVAARIGGAEPRARRRVARDQLHRAHRVRARLHVVAPLAQLVEHVGRVTRLDHQLVGHPLVVEARRRHRRAADPA